MDKNTYGISVVYYTDLWGQWWWRCVLADSPLADNNFSASHGPFKIKALARKSQRFHDIWLKAKDH